MSPEEKREYQRVWYLKNKEKCLAKAKRWALENPDRRKEIANGYTRRNMQRLLAKQRESRKTTYGKSIQVFSGIKCRLKHDKNYCDTKLLISRIDVFNLLSAFSGLCPVCDEETDRPSVDRIDSDGDYELKNLRIICLYCNQRGARITHGANGRFISAR